VTTSTTTILCPNCRAENLGTRFCETCGAPAPAETSTVLAKSAPAVAEVVQVAAPAASTTLITKQTIGRLAIRFAGTAFAATPLASIFYLLPSSFSGITYSAAGLAAIVLTVVTVAGLVVGALLSERPVGAKVGAIALALVAGVAVYVFFLSTILAPFLYFLSWAITARFRGWGYFGLLLTLGGVGLLYFFGFGYLGGTLQFVLVPLGTIGVIAASKAWERAYAKLPPRPERIGAPGSPYAGGVGAVYSEHTNTFAVLALVLGLLGGTALPIVFGHLALGQIRRTGERGHGLAVAGLVLGYISIAAVVVLVIVALAIGFRR
jgi:hypothetical protein